MSQTSPIADPIESRKDALRDYQRSYANTRQRWIEENSYFYSRMKTFLQQLVEPKKRVLNVRCQTGYFLAGLNPSRGVGTELTEELVSVAQTLYPDSHFVRQDSENLSLEETFDYVLFDNVSDTADVLETLRRIHTHCERHSRLIIYTYNHLWEPIVRLAERFGLKMPLKDQSWLAVADLKNMLSLTDFELVRNYRLVLVPKFIPGLSWFFNEVLARLPLINRLCMVNVVVARPLVQPMPTNSAMVSVIIPCRNEAGNIEGCAKRPPELGARTEIIFCNDRSTDNTEQEILQYQRELPQRIIRLVQGPGVNKAKNVFTGFDAAAGDILVILDADLTVVPEELPYFIEALLSGKGELINGSRMVYPIDRAAMKLLNMAGNKFFSGVFSYVLGQRVKDTLCGTKVLWRSDWERIKPFIGSWGVEDRWGDHELLFGAAKLHLKIVDLPVHYEERIFGATKMVNVFANGFRMLRMSWYGFLRLRLHI